MFEPFKWDISVVQIINATNLLFKVKGSMKALNAKVCVCVCIHTLSFTLITWTRQNSCIDSNFINNQCNGKQMHIHSQGGMHASCCYRAFLIGNLSFWFFQWQIFYFWLKLSSKLYFVWDQQLLIVIFTLYRHTCKITRWHFFHWPTQPRLLPHKTFLGIMGKSLSPNISVQPH